MSELKQDLFPLKHSIFDPTGNITALVEDSVDIPMQPAAASELMRLHPEVEQVGFVSSSPAGSPLIGELRMAGGEFCGNASMSAAALLQMKQMRECGSDPSKEETVTVFLKASGAGKPVKITLKRETEDSFRASIRMPEAKGIENIPLSFGAMSGRIPLVRMEGISHLIIEPSSAFFPLLSDREAAGKAVRKWCGEIGADGLGLMFLNGSGSGLQMTPLVYVPGSGTVFWEHSCASGSSAAGMFLADKTGRKQTVTLHEPGGSLAVTSDPGSKITVLRGNVRLMQSFG